MLPPNDYLSMKDYELNRLPDVLAKAETHRLLAEAGLIRRPPLCAPSVWLTCQMCRSLWRLGRLLELTGQRLERRYAAMLPIPA